MSLCPKWKNFWFNVQRLFLTNWVERSFEFRKLPFKPDSFRICFKSRKKSWGIPLPSTPLIKIQLEKLKHDVDCFGGILSLRLPREWIQFSPTSQSVVINIYPFIQYVLTSEMLLPWSSKWFCLARAECPGFILVYHQGSCSAGQSSLVCLHYIYTCQVKT